MSRDAKLLFPDILIPMIEVTTVPFKLTHTK